jgi:hypothetical protein
MPSAAAQRSDGDLGAAFTHATLRSGEDYANESTVTIVCVTASAAGATARGSAPYRVRVHRMLDSRSARRSVDDRFARD